LPRRAILRERAGGRSTVLCWDPADSSTVSCGAPPDWCNFVPSGTADAQLVRSAYKLRSKNRGEPLL